MKISRCIKCQALFTPMSSKDLVCTDCRNATRTATVGTCQIRETPGRCLPFIKGECKECWMFVLRENWIGWHSDCEENFAGKKLPGDDE